jgi:hypothetical protein
MTKNIPHLSDGLAAVLLTLLLTFSVFPQQQDERLMARAYVNSNASRLETLALVDKVVLLTRLAPAALIAGDTEKAAKFAIELQTNADEFKAARKDYFSMHDYAMHISNTVLGLVAFEKGRVAEAGEHLLAAGRLKHGSPPLISFGPNMQLAKRMIEKGERETVIQYFDLCSTFWKMEKGRLEKWKRIVNEGGMPDFKANLVFAINDWKHS